MSGSLLGDHSVEFSLSRGAALSVLTALKGSQHTFVHFLHFEVVVVSP
jgi:hypothetical protein